RTHSRHRPSSGPQPGMLAATSRAMSSVSPAPPSSSGGGTRRRHTGQCATDFREGAALAAARPLSASARPAREASAIATQPKAQQPAASTARESQPVPGIQRAGPAVAVLGQQRAALVGRQRVAVQEALHLVAALRAQEGLLVLGLDALG